jgi:peptidoglycan/LPS O-acetylase OafA/YrhL
MYTFLGRSTEFFIGIFIAIIVKDGIKNERIKILANPIVGFLLAIIFAWILHILSVYFDDDFGIRSTPGIIVNTLLIPIFVVFPFILAFTTNQGRFKFFETRVFQQLGKASYVFYLIHMGVVRSFLGIIGFENEFIVFILLVFFSLLIYHFIEEPLYHNLKRLWVSKL